MSVTTSWELWHKRMGHPSSKNVSLLPDVRIDKNKGLENKSCDVCFRAKQCREVFPLSDSPLSDSKASDIFDLIYCDLWGPYHVPASCGANYFLTIVDDCSRAV